MIKISDYLNYLYSEVVQARKEADEFAVKTAKEYANHDYLKYFRAPRYVMPSVKLDLPIKISEVESNVKYKLDLNKKAYLNIVNNKIIDVNKKENLHIKPITEEQLGTTEFDKLLKNAKKYEMVPVRNKNEVIHSIDTDLIIKSPVLKGHFTTQEQDDKNERVVLSRIMRESLEPFYQPTSVKLNKIFINPSPKDSNEDDKMLIKMNVDMVQEGIQINYVEDENGEKFEKVIID